MGFNIYNPSTGQVGGDSSSDVESGRLTPGVNTFAGIPLGQAPAGSLDTAKNIMNNANTVAGVVLGAYAGGIGGAMAGYSAAQMLNNGTMAQPKAPNLLSPKSLSHTPTQSEVNTSAVQMQLSAERNSMASYMFGASSGVLDQPTTTSRILLGS